MQAAWAMATGEKVLFSEQACCLLHAPMVVVCPRCLHPLMRSHPPFWSTLL